MTPQLKYLPPIKRRLFLLAVFLFAVLSNLLLFLYGKYGILSIILYSLFYAFFMISVFIFTTKGFFIELHEDKKTLEIHKPFSSHEVGLDKVIGMEMIQTKRAYILSLSTQEDTKHYTLTGSLSFEEPLLLPFLRKLHGVHPDINLGESMHGLLHGSSSFDPWSKKMYYAYYTYILTMLGFYIFTLLFVLVFK